MLWIIVMFLSGSHSDGTHSLQSIHCGDTDSVTQFYKPDEETCMWQFTLGVDRYVFFRADADTDYYRSSRPITDILKRYTCLV